MSLAWEKSPDAGRSIWAQPSALGREPMKSLFSLPFAFKGCCWSRTSGPQMLQLGSAAGVGSSPSQAALAWGAGRWLARGIPLSRLGPGPE